MDLDTLLADDKPDGYCKECSKPFWTSWQEDHKKNKPTKIFCSRQCSLRLHHRNYYHKHPEKQKANAEQWRKDNPDKWRKISTKSYLKQKAQPGFMEKARERSKKWYRDNLEKAKESSRLKYLRNKEKRRLENENETKEN